MNRPHGQTKSALPPFPSHKSSFPPQKILRSAQFGGNPPPITIVFLYAVHFVHFLGHFFGANIFIKMTSPSPLSPTSPAPPTSAYGAWLPPVTGCGVKNNVIIPPKKDIFPPARFVTTLSTDFAHIVHSGPTPKFRSSTSYIHFNVKSLCNFP